MPQYPSINNSKKKSVSKKKNKEGELNALSKTGKEGGYNHDV